MDDFLKKKIMENEKKHKRYLIAYRIGEFFKDLRENATKKDSDDLASIFGFLGLLVGSYLLVHNILGAIVLFVVINCILSLTGKILYKKFRAKLEELKRDCASSLSTYCDAKCKEFGICVKSDSRYNEDDSYSIYESYDAFIVGHLDIPRQGAICFPDGVIIRNEHLDATMRTSFGNLTIYQLKKKKERTTFEEARKKTTSCINDKISSLDFNAKFGIITSATTSELICMKYLTPSMQVKMINADKISRFSNINIKESNLSMSTGKSVKLPTAFRIYDKKPLMKYYEEVDTYCQEMRKMADEIYADFQTIDFIRGNKTQ